MSLEEAEEASVPCRWIGLCLKGLKEVHMVGVQGSRDDLEGSPERLYLLY